MRKFIFQGIAICLLAGCTPASKSASSTRRQPESTAWILALSDIHLNNTPGPTKFGQDTRADLWEWTLEKLDSILAGKGSWHSPALILYTGDLPCHDDILPDPQARKRMADTVRITLQNKANAAGIPIIFAKGNNEYPEDYCVNDTGYSATALEDKHLKIIALNTVPYSSGYDTHKCDTCAACNAVRLRVVDDQMNWLHQQLEDIKDQEKAIIIMHVPPGKDGFKKAKVEDLWNPTLGGQTPNLQSQFQELMAMYSDKIAGILAGHSHKDGIRVLFKEGQPGNTIFSIPSISPVYLNNPGFKMIAYDPSTLRWENMITYYLDQRTYDETGQWTLGSYDLRTVLSVKENDLNKGILELAKKDPAALTNGISPVYYVRSRNDRVKDIDNIERSIFVGAAWSLSTTAQSRDTTTFFLHKFAQNIGKEINVTDRTEAGMKYNSAFMFVDRGTPVSLAAELTVSSNFEPRSLFIKGGTSRFSFINDSVHIRDGRAWIKVGDSSYTRDLERNSFPVAGYSPGIVQMILLKYWLSHGQPASIPVLPSGTVHIRKDGTDVVGGSNLNRYLISGLVWGNELVWTDDHNDELVCLITNDAEGDKLEIMNARDEPLLPELLKRAATYGMAIFQKEMANPDKPSPTAIIGGTLIDVATGATTPNSVILLNKGRIKAIGKAGELKIPSNYTTIHAEGKTILPGLWDMHAHFEQAEWGPAYLAAGVTTVRDCGNEFTYINAVKSAIDKGAGVGPHIIKAGIIDGPGPMGLGIERASTPAEVVKLVRKYKDNGFDQIKIYSSVTPDVVKAICDEAHRLGLTVTGHIPEGMTLQQGVDSGMDMINHVQYVYSVMKKNGDRSVNPTDSANLPVLQFIKTHGTVIDPTLGVFEMIFRNTKDDITEMEPAFSTLPQPLQALFKNMGMDPTMAPKYKPLLESMGKIVRAMHDQGITIVAGTDMGFPGYSLDRELELYVAAGLTPLEAIQKATMIPARVMKKNTGLLKPGLQADLIIVEGDPLTRIRDIRNVRTVIKEGKIYDPAVLHKLAGFGK